MTQSTTTPAPLTDERVEQETLKHALWRIAYAGSVEPTPENYATLADSARRVRRAHFELLTEVERLRAESQAWKDFAMHAADCADCYDLCSELCSHGRKLKDAAESFAARTEGDSNAKA